MLFSALNEKKQKKQKMKSVISQVIKDQQSDIQISNIDNL